MTELRVAAIVEGHGEVECVRLLLDRIWRELLSGNYVEVLKPIRQPRSRMLRQGADGNSVVDRDEVSKAIQLASKKLAASTEIASATAVLLLLDADHECPKQLVERMRPAIDAAGCAVRVILIFAKIEYETWFVAAAESLGEFVNVSTEDIPHDPEAANAGKGWIKGRFIKPTYSEPIDQPRLTARMDLNLCRSRSASFDKLVRELALLRS